jgi:hypothetical protein
MRQSCTFSRCLAAVLPFLFASAVALAAIQEKKADEKDDKEPVKTRKLEIADDLVTEVPVTWKAQKATSRFRIHQFDLPRAKGDKADGNLVFFHFGKGGGGGLAANLKRWYGMVEPTEESKEKPKPKEIESDDVKITWLDLAGTYLDRPTPFSQTVTRRDHYRMWAAYIDAGASGPYYLRAFGPNKTMLAQRKSFEKMLNGIKQK